MTIYSSRDQNPRTAPCAAADDFRLLWLLRLLIPLEGYKTFLQERQFYDNNLAQELGFQELDGRAQQGCGYDRGRALGELRSRWHNAEARGLTMPSDTTLGHNIARLGEAVKLTEAETRIVHFAVLVRLDWILQVAISCVGASSLQILERLFATCLDLDVDDVKHALSDDSTLFRTGILWLDLDSNYEFASKVELLRGLPDELQRNHANPLGLFRNNIVSAPPPRLTPVDYPHLTKDIHILEGYLGRPGTRPRKGTNILIYGAPGSGKTEFVRMLGRRTGLQLYEVATESRNGLPLAGERRFRAYRLAQSLLESSNESLILFDEIEDVFRETGDDPIRKGNQSGVKAWVNRLMEENPVPAFWLTNNIHSVDPAVIRRFDYVMEMNAPPRSVRARILENYLDDLPVSEKWKRDMAENEGLVPAVVERATKVVHALKDKLPANEAEIVLDRVMGNTLEALGLRLKAEARASNETDYRLDILNADCDVGEICEGLLRERKGRLCLYGPPGTGKTAFGRHVAELLDRPLLVRRASDILSPLVGEAEKNMAQMFRQSKEENAVLLLDEADSYLRDRRGAQRPWEVSEVNEMLTQIERFDGVFIASTNLMESLDGAALRRFDVKMRFDYPTADQTWLLFCDTAKKLGLIVEEDLRSSVAELRLLAPGDFATIVRQARLRKIKDCDELYHRLAVECAGKPEGRQRKIGF